jgi:hypothetical protein
LIGQPANYPTELAEALRRLFSKKPAVRRAWLAHFHNPAREEKPHTLLGVEMAGNWDEVSADAGSVIEAVQVPDPPVDMIQVSDKDELGDYFRKTRPFYQRKVFGLF